MNYRLNKFYARASHAGTPTVVIDINIQDIISGIVIKHEALQVVGMPAAHSLSCVTKIELVDGSDVLYSLDGYEAEALDWYNNGGQFRQNLNYYLNGWSHSRLIGLNFGRYLWDTEYAFDPKRFNNPQLRISLSCGAMGAGCVTNYLTCWANLFDEKVPSLKGFFMSKEVKKYTIVNNTHEYTDMPLDFPWRGLYFRPFTVGTEPNQCVANIKLSEDQDRRVPIDNPPNDILNALISTYPLVDELIRCPVAGGGNPIYVAPSTLVFASGNSWAVAPIEMDLGFYSLGGGRITPFAVTADGNAQIRVCGYVPHCVYRIPFGKQGDDTDWYDVRRIGSLRLDILGAVGAGVGSIFLQQVRAY